ncbi:MAG: tetratricopeptide (TPR) repeat protein [Paraglaciecola sp.]|jgi:tetratricopeptide (TPR) repeat protein
MAILTSDGDMQLNQVYIQNFFQLHNSINLNSCIFILAILFSSSSIADAYRPTNNQVVASWDNSQSLSNTRVSLQNVEWHLQQSQYPGSSNLHLRQASMMLDSLLDTQADKPEYWYYKARVFEHQHQFTPALQALENAIELDANFVSAWLMKSNVLLLMGQNDSAKTTCLRLVGMTNIDIALACSLQTAKGEEQVKKAYATLQPLVKRIQHDTENIAPSHLWLVQLVADMATQLTLTQESAVWMNTYPLEKTPISYMSQWADTQLDLGQYENVLNKLGDIVEQAGYQDDALLMRLAMAEIKMEPLSRDIDNTSKKWQLAAKNRVTLRLQRNDTYHAADLSRFYIYIEPNAEHALFWAQQNLTQSLSHEDYALLKTAQAMVLKQQTTVKES